MFYPEICTDLCMTCDPCSAGKACRTRAIVKLDADEPPYVEVSRCNRCGKCVLSCCCGAIVMRNPNGSHTGGCSSAEGKREGG